MARVEDKLEELGINLPDNAVPLGSYKPAQISGDLIYISGQLPLAGGRLLFNGKVGDNISIEDGVKAAREASINAIAIMKSQLEDLNRVKKIVKLTGYVASAPGFNGQANVINGASDLLYDVFGEKGNTRQSCGRRI